MSNLTLIIVLLLSFGGMGALLVYQIRENRRRGILVEPEMADYSIAHMIVDYVAFKMVYWCKQLAEKFYLFLIFFLRHSLSVIRFIVVRVEKKFGRFTDALQKRQQVIHVNGSVSSFLREIKDHKEAVNALAPNEDATDVEKRI